MRRPEAGRHGTRAARGRPRASRRPGFWLVVVATLVSAVGGCATVDQHTDVRIESEVKARLVAEKVANLTRLGVLSQRGIVQLSGTVASADHRVLAEELAGRVGGVKRVINRLEVGAVPTQ
jgi:osmotically-inducible protein OsmY